MLEVTSFEKYRLYFPLVPFRNRLKHSIQVWYSRTQWTRFITDNLGMTAGPCCHLPAGSVKRRGPANRVICLFMSVFAVLTRSYLEFLRRLRISGIFFLNFSAL